MSFAKDIVRNVLDAISLGPTFPLRHVSRLIGRRYHTTNIKHVGKVTLRPKSSDAEVFVDIFRRKAYDFSWLKQYNEVVRCFEQIRSASLTPIIVDAGANVGAASIWFSREFPGSKVIAVEPDPDNLVVLHMNARERANIVIVPAAIGAEAGTAKLEQADSSGWSVQTARDPAGKVPVISIEEIMNRYGGENPLFLVKIDIEGFESDLFSTNLDWIDNINVLVIEPHDWLHPRAGTSRGFRQAMLDRNFEMIISGENLIYLRQ